MEIIRESRGVSMAHCPVKKESIRWKSSRANAKFWFQQMLAAKVSIYNFAIA